MNLHEMSSSEVEDAMSNTLQSSNRGSANVFTVIRTCRAEMMSERSSALKPFRFTLSVHLDLLNRHGPVYLIRPRQH